MPDDVEVAGALIDHLRRSLAHDSLDYADRPTKVSGGYDTTIYSFALRNAPPQLSGPLILRLFGVQNLWIKLSTPERARFETAVQNVLHDSGSVGKGPYGLE